MTDDEKMKYLKKRFTLTNDEKIQYLKDIFWEPLIWFNRNKKFNDEDFLYENAGQTFKDLSSTDCKVILEILSDEETKE